MRVTTMNLNRAATVAGAALRALIALAATLAGAVGPPAAARAQPPTSSVALSFGVDTTAANVAPIVRLVRAYLARPDATTAAARGLWSTADPTDRRLGDYGGAFAYQGFPVTVLNVLSAGPGDSVYVVKLLHATADSAGRRALRTAPNAVPEMLRYVRQQLGLPEDDPGALDRWWRENAAGRAGAAAGR